MKTKAKLWDNPIVVALLLAIITGGAAFWLRVEKHMSAQMVQMEAQEKQIASLEKQSERLTEAVTEIWREIWGTH